MQLNWALNYLANVATRIILFCFLLMTQAVAFAQSCSIQASNTIICIGNTVTLSVSVTGGVPISYSWNLGDANTSTQAVVVHSYTSTGFFTPSVTVNLQGGGSCSAFLPALQVVALPVASFLITSPDTLCYKNNALCIRDVSTPGLSGAPITQRVFQLNNGYIQSDNPPFSPIICYQNTTDFFGRLYDILLEVTDTNGCVSRLLKQDSVYLLPRNQEIGFVSSVLPGCDTSVATFTNTSVFLQSQAKEWIWDFGNGQTDATSTRWASITHKYVIQGTYSPKLIVKDRNDCIDTFTLVNGVRHLNADSSIGVTSLNPGLLKFCYSTQLWSFSNTGPGNKFWRIYKDGEQIDSLLQASIWDKYSFPTCGTYKVELIGSYANCSWKKDTVLNILGPKAQIENDTIKLINRNQCQIHDTVYFNTPQPYLSCHNGNTRMYRLWDFNDPYAPPCTTDTRNNINVGVNCRYSRDSIGVKHRYYDGREDCYLPSLYMIDSASGCFDGDTVSVSLSPPDAGPGPGRSGLYYKGQTCLNSLLEFYLDSLLPLCGFERVWINWDTACTPKAWELQDTIVQKIIKVPHVYTNHCSPDGKVVVGIVIRNGKDASGNYCYDTAYYPFFDFIVKDPAFGYTKLNECPPYQLVLQLVDTIQPEMESVYWLIERVFAGTGIKIKDTTQVMNGDSLIRRVGVTLPNNGSYRIFIGMRDTAGCLQGFRQAFSIGFRMDMGVMQEVQCVNTPFTLIDNVRYFDPMAFEEVLPRNYWAETDRQAAGKEQLWWDIGDGKGFQPLGSSPSVSYSKPGVYTIKLVAKDSLSCYDTLVFLNFITVVEPKARIWASDSLLLCAPQIVSFRDSSLFLDSMDMPAFGVPDFITSWYWDFDDNKQPRILQNPAHNFTSNGTFNVMLVITTAQGCTDTAYKDIVILGPQPRFEIDDTLGCMPFPVTFTNTTNRQLLSWTWYFGDSNNTILPTQNDSAVRFVYNQPGIYAVRLLGIDTLRNPSTGNLITCTAIFPDTNTNIPARTVYVEFTPQLSISGPDSICPNQEAEFSVSGDPIYTAYTWYFTSSDSINKQNPDTLASYIYRDAGEYTVRIIPYTTTFTACADTPLKTIRVLDIEAGFEIDETNAPDYQLSNTSAGAVRFEWFDSKDQTSNPFSVAANPTYRFQGDSFSFVICQKVYNAQDCWDTVCKEVYYYSDIIVPNVFTPGNADNTNDAFDIEIVGEKKYELVIYNRWGGMVFKGDKDGTANDGINWNGKKMNEGEECPAGVYYYVFTYRFMTDDTDRKVNGTITLIR